MKRFMILLCVVICCVSGYANGAVNLVQNGGFETGDFTSWVPPDGYFWTDVTMQDNGLSPRSGQYFAEFGEYPPSLDTISQAIATTPGQTYHFGFWLASEAPPYTPNEMQVTWDGNQIADEVNFTSTDWVRFSFTEVATSDLTVISFSGNSAQFLGLDNVNVEATPEPTTMIVWGLLGMVVAGYGVVRRRRAA